MAFGIIVSLRVAGVERIFLTLYCIEACIRLTAGGWSTFKDLWFLLLGCTMLRCHLQQCRLFSLAIGIGQERNDFILAGWIWCWSLWVFWPCLWFRSWQLKPAFPLKNFWWSGACAYFAWWEPWGWVHFEGLNARDDGARWADLKNVFIVIICSCSHRTALHVLQGNAASTSV